MNSLGIVCSGRWLRSSALVVQVVLMCELVVQADRSDGSRVVLRV
jgi:hypothetical protein